MSRNSKGIVIICIAALQRDNQQTGIFKRKGYCLNDSRLEFRMLAQKLATYILATALIEWIGGDDEAQ